MTYLSPAAWRSDCNLTLEGAGRAVGVAGKNPARTWQRWERGQLEPPIKVIALVQKLSRGKVTPEAWAQVRELYLSRHREAA